LEQNRILKEGKACRKAGKVMSTKGRNKIDAGQRNKNATKNE
jgi:hypothetical protein